MRRMRYSIGLLAVALAACSSGSGVLAISDSWAPSMPPNAPTAAIYLTIDNGTGSDDQLLAVSSPRCGTTEIHSTTIDENRVMKMRPATPEQLQIPAGDKLEMMPGGLHVMCIDPTAPLADGEMLDVTVTFEKAGNIAITTPVEDR